MAGRIKILDCTLRDGGLGLEDAYINKKSDVGFTTEVINEIILHLKKSNIDIIELGSIEISESDKRRFAIYPNIEEVSKKKPHGNAPGQMYAALYRGPDTNIEDIPDYTSELTEGVRVIIRYSEMEKSLDFCAALSQKGYKVFVQPMLTARYTEEELKKIIKASNEMNAYALYFVDSYGYMQHDDIIRFFKLYDSGLSENIKIGFHAHNNMNLAYANALTFINIDTKREIIVDSCAVGMGQGAGNLQTELISFYLQNINDNKYDYSEILDVCEIIEQYLSPNLWGYSAEKLISALHKTAYKYASLLKSKYGFTLRGINDIIEKMPDYMRNRYTEENLKKIIEKYFN